MQIISTEDLLKGFEKIINKTVKEDSNLVYQILFNGLSAYTSKPSHLMINEKSAQGKSYPALEISQYFPEEDIIILASATPQSFKYQHGELVDDEYNSIEPAIEGLEKDIEFYKKENNKTDEAQAKEAIEELKKESKILIDFRNKWVIFTEPPDTRLIQMMYATLSSDKEFLEHILVNKNGKGQNKSFKVVLRGTPAVLICSARDETEGKRWEETFTRFAVVSPKSTPEKYKAGMELISKEYGLPKELYEESVISESDKQLGRHYISGLIQTIKESKGEILNLFQDKMAKQFPQEAGFRWRQFKRFNNLLRIYTLCYRDQRPYCLMKRKIPIPILEDLKWAIDTAQDSEFIPPNKLQWFRDVFKKAFTEKNQEVNFGTESKPLTRNVITGSDIIEYMLKNKLGKPTVKQIRENYIKTLFDHGYLEKDHDPRNRNRDVYWPSEGNNNSKSPLIAISSFNASCLELFVNKMNLRRFEYGYNDNKISVSELVKIVIEPPKSEPKNSNDDLTFNGDSKNMATHGDEQRQMTIDGEMN